MYRNISIFKQENSENSKQFSLNFPYQADKGFCPPPPPLLMDMSAKNVSFCFFTAPLSTTTN